MSRAPGNESAAAAERFFPGADIEPVGGRSWLVSTTIDDRRFSVRQLDPSLPSNRIDIVHEFLAQPDILASTTLAATERRGSLSFDARSWVAGETTGVAIPLAEWQTLHLPAQVETDALVSIARALGDFHRSGTSTSLIARTPRFRVKEAIMQARRSLDWNERALANEIRKESRARRWLTASRVLLANASTNLERAEFMGDEPLVMAHLDLWGSHIIGASPAGPVFLDCQMITAAPAAVDLAQLVARNGAWSDARVEQVLTAYTETNQIPPLQRRLLPWLAALDAIGSCGGLLARGHDERHPLAESDRRAVLAASDQQLEFLQALVTAFVPPPPRKYRYASQRPGHKAKSS